MKYQSDTYLPFRFSTNDLQIRSSSKKESYDVLKVEICGENNCGKITVHFEDKLRIKADCLEDINIEYYSCASKKKTWTVHINETEFGLFCNSLELLSPGLILGNDSQECRDVWSVERLTRWRIIEPEDSTADYRARPDGLARSLLKTLLN